jgi:hypothetical protein
MNNALLPIIEELQDAPDDAARARWLLEVPAGVLMTYQSTIINRLRHARFAWGVEYVEAEVTRYRARRVDGEIIQDNPLAQLMREMGGR